jgi:hypothetical protein
MPSRSGPGAQFRVQFDAALLVHDANNSTPKAREILNQTVQELHQHGILNRSGNVGGGFY